MRNSGNRFSQTIEVNVATGTATTVAQYPFPAVSDCGLASYTDPASGSVKVVAVGGIDAYTSAFLPVGLSDKAAVYDVATATWDSSSQHVATAPLAFHGMTGHSLEPYASAVVFASMGTTVGNTREVWRFTPPSAWERLGDLSGDIQPGAHVAIYNL